MIDNNIQIKHMNARMLKDELDKNEIILIDVREATEYAAGHIEKAINIPLSQIDNFQLKSKDLINKKVVFQCKAGIRSVKAILVLQNKQLSFDMWNLEGGLLAWQEAGLPTIF